MCTGFLVVKWETGRLRGSYEFADYLLLNISLQAASRPAPICYTSFPQPIHSSQVRGVLGSNPNQVWYIVSSQKFLTQSPFSFEF